LQQVGYYLVWLFWNKGIANTAAVLITITAIIALILFRKYFTVYNVVNGLLD
jgi:hypothetical protein